MKEDAKDDKNSTIGNHNVYQCDLETLLHAEKINDKVRLKAPSKIIDNKHSFCFTVLDEERNMLQKSF